jgi:MerR family copper efflux transcriptional regulator
MRISELAKRSGVSGHTLRYYEARGLLRASRDRSGYRDFPEATLRDLTFIRMGREIGFPLKEIGELLPTYRAGTLTAQRMIEIFRARIGAIDTEVARLRALRSKLIAHIGWFRRQASTPRKKAPR